MKTYSITYIGRTQLQEYAMTETEAIQFFLTMGETLTNARMNMIPAFIVKEINSMTRENKSIKEKELIK